MQDFLDVILSRRSTKSFIPDKYLPNDILEKIIDAGRHSPTGMNKQSPIIIAVTDKKIRDELSKDNALVRGVHSDPYYGAPTILCVLAKKDVHTYIYDGSIVMENMMLAAHSLGVGSCWIHRAKQVFEMPKWKEFLSSLGIEGEYEGIGNLALGYKTEEYSPKEKTLKPDWVYYVK